MRKILITVNDNHSQTVSAPVKQADTVCQAFTLVKAKSLHCHPVHLATDRNRLISPKKYPLD